MRNVTKTENGLTIKTDNRRRPLLRWEDLSEKEREKFTYLDTEEAQQAAEFVRYRGWTYNITEEFSTTHRIDALAAWDGYAPDTYFSGVLVLMRGGNGEDVIMGRYYN